MCDGRQIDEVQQELDEIEKKRKEEQTEKPHERQPVRACANDADENRSRGNSAVRAPDASTCPILPEKDEALEDMDDGYEDRGDFKLCQDNYVRPNFPPLYDDTPPAPFPNAQIGRASCRERV